ncbi:MAG: UDP-N-acetylglucosamine--N-acetylmuramyl-(pentapeptide) pyrophosphoryl-undecaprenol N-acetylglucosamine transferase [Parcubacteria group bacterium]|nr:UDP-N-acetylglucosamine--N-acetylmuramyl-(pentapeptide) pyrophosphoryl-undecaprenol N-acetylglucosamine transferase [Parcubacteria group bacterium]
MVKKIIAAGKMRRYFSWLNLLEPFKIPLAFIQSLIIVASINPDAVLGKGSYGSIWPVLAAWVLRKKIVLHESDAVPGLANKFLSKFTNHVALAFEETGKLFPKENTHVVGNPVRLKYIGLTKDEAETILAIKVNRKIVFISGGSQGAQRINNIILRALPGLLESYFIIWSVGSSNHQDLRSKTAGKNNLLISALFSEKELAAAYTLCDLAVGRAGAGTIFELAAFGKPSILIPLERKGGDQPHNAKIYADTGAAIILEESGLTAQKLFETLNKTLSDSNLLAAMSQKAKEFAKIDAGEELAKILLNLANS